MIHKSWDTATNKYIEQYAKTVTSMLYTDSGITKVFDEAGKLKAGHMPDIVFDNLEYSGNLDSYDDLKSDVYSDMEKLVRGTLGRSIKGLYYVTSTTVSKIVSTTVRSININFANTSDPVLMLHYKVQVINAEGTLVTEGTVNFQPGDWCIISNISGANVSASKPYVVTLSVVRNAYELATNTELGIVKFGDATVLSPGGAKVYPVRTDGSGGMHVEVPWTDNNTQLTNAQVIGSTLSGLVITGAVANVKNTDTIVTAIGRLEQRVALNDVKNTNVSYSLPKATASSLGGIQLGYTNTAKKYKLQVDASGNGYVDVPWTDTNTNTLYTAGANGGLDLASNAFSMKFPVFVQAAQPVATIQGTIWFDIS